MEPTPLHLAIDADTDLGVMSRVLDYLIAQGRFPLRVAMDRHGDDMRLRIVIDYLIAEKGALVAARLRRIPGVRNVIFYNANEAS